MSGQGSSFRRLLFFSGLSTPHSSLFLLSFSFFFLLAFSFPSVLEAAWLRGFFSFFFPLPAHRLGRRGPAVSTIFFATWGFAPAPTRWAAGWRDCLFPARPDGCWRRRWAVPAHYAPFFSLLPCGFCFCPQGSFSASDISDGRPACAVW